LIHFVHKFPSVLNHHLSSRVYTQHGRMIILPLKSSARTRGQSYKSCQKHFANISQ
jgi:hypothetical protein